MAKQVKIIVKVIVLSIIIVIGFSMNEIVCLFMSVNGISIPVEKKDYSFKEAEGFFSIDYSTVNNFNLLLDFAGWALIPTNYDNDNKSIKLILIGESDKHVYQVKAQVRKLEKTELANHVPEEYIKGDNGFRFVFTALNMKNGVYRLAIYDFENEKNNGLLKTEYRIEKKGKEVSIKK